MFELEQLMHSLSQLLTICTLGYIKEPVYMISKVLLIALKTSKRQRTQSNMKQGIGLIRIVEK